MRKKSIACRTPRTRSTSAVARHSNSVDQVAAVGDSSPSKCEDDDKSEQSDKGSPEIFVQESTESDKMEKHRCIKCDKVGIGKMLVCTEIGCPVAIHKECLIPKPYFDDSGNFYCPYCAYKRAVDKVQRLRKKAMLAKEQLSNFHKVPVVDSIGGKDHENEKEEKAATASPQSEDSIYHAHEIQPNQHVDETVAAATEKCDKENEETHQVNLEDTAVTKGHKEIGSSEKTKKATGESNESHESHNESVSESVENKSHESHNETVSEVSENVQQNDKAPKSSTHVRKVPSHEKKEENVFPTLGKRKRMAWTLEEEEMLKDGVKIFSNSSKNLPWRKILQYGSHVFHQSRVPADLQNKWKNMTRKC